ncbi:M15 family metallopeptidase [Arthrobacter sp. Z1-15]
MSTEYVPRNLIDVGGVSLRAEAGEAFLQLLADAAASEVAITAVSGFRRASEQADLHSSYTDSYGGPAAESLSARPGHSEHQTGLAVDIANPDGTCSLQPCFEGTAAGSWAAANADRYGFVVRYPAGAEAVTGYSYEPWHLRYIGVDSAQRIVEAGITLEEFANLPAAPGY